MKAINLGSGKKCYSGFLNVDKFKVKGVDKVVDLDKFPYPFKDSEFDVVRCEHSLECLGEFIKVMEEIHRIGKPNSIIEITVTPFCCPMACADPLDKKFFCYTSFDYFQIGTGLDYYSSAKFEIIKKKYIFSQKKGLKWLSFIPNIYPKFYTRFLSFIFPSNELYFELKVVK
jgi:ubiquinone/menaquinone biosynthesis C-methylase UbiE